VAIINPNKKFLPVNFYGEGLALSQALCRIENFTLNNMAMGTGFLIGPKLVITNYHVVNTGSQDDQKLTEATKNLVFRFGYTNPQTDVATIRTFTVDPQNPIVAFSDMDRLNYVLLRLAESPRTIDGKLIKPISPKEARKPLLQEEVFILQHPQGESAKFSNGAVLKLADNLNRVQYDANTLPGSSGSPIFVYDEVMKLVGIHTSKWVSSDNQLLGNEGIPFFAILAEIQAFLDIGEESVEPESVEIALKVFLCHSSYDKPPVRQLHQRLQSDGFRAWFDEKDLLPGQDWDLEIRKAINESDIVVVCLSQNAVTKRDHMNKQLNYALEIAQEQPADAIFIIPAKLEECIIPDNLKKWQPVNFFDAEGYSRLVKVLKARAGIS
jgi:TIR domain/Trypsin-like peptidase domain